jgi:hypothetical protein
VQDLKVEFLLVVAIQCFGTLSYICKGKAERRHIKNMLDGRTKKLQVFECENGMRRIKGRLFPQS